MPMIEDLSQHRPSPRPNGSDPRALIERCTRQAYIAHGAIAAVEGADGRRDPDGDLAMPDVSDAYELPEHDGPKGQAAIDAAIARNKAHQEDETQRQSESSLPSPPAREGLTARAWMEKEIPPRDHLLGGVMCTTSRWFIFGETGIGKTLVGMTLGGAVAAGANFLHWAGQRKARVMYLDGELPIETFKERIELLVKRYGPDIEFYGYNREDLGDEGLPPLNTEYGQAWLRREIVAIKPDLIIFDSIMCLLFGSMLDEATWMPMRPFVRWLTANHIAQIWLHHANDSGKSFGDKTREWEMDTVVFLSRPPGEDGAPDDTAIRLEFRKARLRTPANAEQFLSLLIRAADDWEFETAPKNAAATSSRSAGSISREYLQAYDRLADGVTKTHGFDGKLVKKLQIDAIRDELKSRGYLDQDENGATTTTARSHLWRAKTDLLKSGKLIERGGWIWRP
jgi:AAA domain